MLKYKKVLYEWEWMTCVYCTVQSMLQLMTRLCCKICAWVSPHTHVHSRNWTPNTLRVISRHQGIKIRESVKVTGVASSSAACPQIDGPMDTVKEALDTFHYLLAQSWVDHYPTSKTCPYVDLSLHNAALETCQSLLEMTIHNIQQDYSNMSD